MKWHLKNARRITNLLENRFKFLWFRFGLEPIIGLIPGLGDTLTFIISFYLVWIALKYKLPGEKIMTMVINIVFDYVIGLIPVLGDMSDFLFKANERNMRIIEAEIKPEK